MDVGNSFIDNNGSTKITGAELRQEGKVKKCLTVIA
jgi:hypothetical protein